MTKRVDLPQGTLEILIWKFRVPRAFAWIQHSASHPANFRRTPTGSFCTAIYRLERSGWIKGE